MIDNERSAQVRWQAVIDAMHTGPWTQWDFKFIWGNYGNPFHALSEAQQKTAERLYQKLGVE